MNKSICVWALSIIITSLICFGSGCANMQNPEVVGQGDAQVVSPTENPAPGEYPVVSPSLNPDGNLGGSDSIDPGLPSEPFIPEIEDFDNPVEIGGSYDFSTQYDYTGATLTLVDGYFIVDQDENGYYYQASGSRALSVNTSVAFPYGTISADVINNASDTGIVFGLSSTKTHFWEGSGISYYFFFINFGGTAYLGKADNGGWAALAEYIIPDWTASTSYNIKAVFMGNKILCFLNDQHIFSYSDANVLTGTGWGVRAGDSGAIIKNVQISSQFVY